MSIQQRRNSARDFDSCSANVQSDWFMTTNNSYHILNENDDLLFNEEEKFGVPIIIPTIPATAENYFTVPAIEILLIWLRNDSS